MATGKVNKQKSGFRTEKELSHIFSPEACIRSQFGYSGWHSWEGDELEGLFGIPDHIAIFWKKDSLNRRIVRTFAFEMKRDHWKRALIQAYRYASFADYSFVVLDHVYVHRAIAGISNFTRANIGLLSVRPDGEVIWHFRPRHKAPYSKHMTHLLQAALDVHLFGPNKIKPNNSIGTYFSKRVLRGIK